MKKKNKQETETKVIKTKQQPKNLTTEEAAIFQRIQAEDNEWETIPEDETLDYSLAEDPFKLPPEAIKLRDQKKLAFRWVTRKPERVDEIRSLDVPRRWWIVNATNVPELANKVDPMLGGVVKLDQILVFKPYWMYEAENKMKQDMITARDKEGDLASKHKMPVDESGSQFLSGKEYKIGTGDEVLLHEADTGDGVAFEPGDDSLGNIVEE